MQTGSFSLQDALTLQGERSSPTSADELAEAESAMAELRDDQRLREVQDATTTAARDASVMPVATPEVVNLADSDETKSSDGDVVEARPSAPSSAFAASAMMPVNIDRSPRPSPPPTSNAKNNSNSNNNRSPHPPPPPSNGVRRRNSGGGSSNGNRKNERGVISLNGTLEPLIGKKQDGTQEMRSIMRGRWRLSSEASKEANPQHTFEFVSKGGVSSYVGEPTSGNYSGHFVYMYVKTTSKGKRSTKISKIAEHSIKLEFRKLKEDLYRVQGFGKNAAFGDFSLGGIAKPVGRGRFTIELRKKYKDLSENSTTTTARNTTPLSLPRSQPQSMVATRPNPSVDPPPYPERVKSEPRTPEPVRSNRGESSDESGTESESESESQANFRKRREERDPERQGIPGAEKITTPQPTPQKLPDPAVLSQTPTRTGVDRVNGRGMWHAWTRSFDTPLLALLDLFDNAVDASWTLLPKRNDRRKLPKPKIRVDLDRYGRNGVVIRNASTFIPSLQQVLQVYKSSKAGEGDNSIGENGIGVKHACASLSGLSFVFTKTTDSTNGSCTLSMGILMQDLQRDDGIVLPSMAFPVGASRNGSLEEVREKLEKHCENNPDTWGKAVLEYGDDHFGQGIDQCIDHMDFLRRDHNWRNSENVFAVVLASLKHAAFNNDGEEEDDNEIIMVDGVTSDSAMARRNPNGTTSTTYHTVQRGGDTDIDEDEQRSLSLLKTLRENLPYLYLHLQDLDICVERKAIESIYWEARLTELSKFELQLSQTELWSKPSRVRNLANNGKNGVTENGVFDITNQKEAVRFFCGFDPFRCQSPYAKKVKCSSSANSSDDDKMMSNIPGGSNIAGGLNHQQNNSAMKIFLYSRQSGRLIKVQDDPRNELRLCAGSTDFCQGLTVIIDDHNGSLPLNPTKQDTAYGHSKHGEIHAANLKEWTAAITHFYWNYHYERFGSSKVAVTHAVANSRPTLEKAYKKYRRSQKKRGSANGDHGNITPLCEGKFISYPGIEFNLSKHRDIPKIRAKKSSRISAVPVIDHQSLIARLDEDAAALVIANRPTNLGSARKKRARHKIDDQEVVQQESNLEVASTPAKRLREAHDNEIDRQDDRVSSDREPMERNWISNPQQAQENNALRAQNQQLTGQLRQYYKMNTELTHTCKNSTSQIMLLKNEIDKFGQARACNEQEIRLLKRELSQMKERHQKQLQETSKWKEEALRLGKDGGAVASQSYAPPASQYASQTPPSTPNRGESTELDKVKREVKIYKSRAEFYKRETESKKKQIDTLMQEKSRFEERVQELEEAQLAVGSHGGDLMLL